MECTVCSKKLDARKKRKYVYASYQLRSKGILGNLMNKDYWVFCSNGCKLKADQDWMIGNFEKLYGKKMIDFKP